MILTSRIPLYNMAMLSCVIRSTNFQKNDDRYDKLLFLRNKKERDNDDDGFFLFWVGVEREVSGGSKRGTDGSIGALL